MRHGFGSETIFVYESPFKVYVCTPNCYFGLVHITIQAFPNCHSGLVGIAVQAFGQKPLD